MSKPSRIGCFLIPFGGIFFLIGSVFFAVVLFDTFETAKTYTWPKTSAVINSIDIDFPKPAPRSGESGIFELKTNYTYQVDGREFQGTSFRRNRFTSSDYEDLADCKARLIHEEVQHAFVNPDDPSEAILKRNSLWTGLLLLAPIPFMAIGLACILAGLGWIGQSRKKATKTTSFKKDKASRLGVGIFGAMFLFAGLLALYFLAVGPMIHSYAAKGWKEVPCTVIWSRVAVHDGEDDDTYSPDIFFEYSFNGETHHSNQYSFVETSTNAHRKHAKTVAQYPAGKKTTCFVDPSRPWHAVLRRDTSQIGFWWLFPFPFIAVGLGFLVAAVRMSLGR